MNYGQPEQNLLVECTIYQMDHISYVVSATCAFFIALNESAKILLGRPLI